MVAAFSGEYSCYYRGDPDLLDMLSAIVDKIQEMHSRPIVGGVSSDALDKLALIQQSMAALANTGKTSRHCEFSLSEMK